MRRCLVDLIGGYRCDRVNGHDGLHCVGGKTIAVSDVVRLNWTQYTTLKALATGERVVVPPMTRKWLLKRGWITIVGKTYLSTGCQITQEGLSAFGRAIKDWNTGKEE